MPKCTNAKVVPSSEVMQTNVYVLICSSLGNGFEKSILDLIIIDYRPAKT